MKAVIIEDENKAISVLKAELKHHCSNVEIIGEAQNIKDAQILIQELQPQLVFLDIQLADGLGFEVLENFKQREFQVIFTTAYSQYAIKAIKFSALDYLLKPIVSNELKIAVEKAELYHKNNSTSFSQIELLFEKLKNAEKKEKIALQTSEGITIYETNSILFCTSEGNYTNVFFTNGKKQLFSKPLKEFEELLENSNFERIHHSHIINLNHLVSFVNKDGGYVVLSDKSTLPVSLRKKSSLIEKLQLLK